MKSLKCIDLGVRCDFEITGKNDEEVIKKMIKHGKRHHKEIVKSKSKDELIKLMHEHIHELAQTK